MVVDIRGRRDGGGVVPRRVCWHVLVMHGLVSAVMR